MKINQNWNVIAERRVGHANSHACANRASRRRLAPRRETTRRYRELSSFDFASRCRECRQIFVITSRTQPRRPRRPADQRRKLCSLPAIRAFNLAHEPFGPLGLPPRTCPGYPYTEITRDSKFPQPSFSNVYSPCPARWSVVGFSDGDAFVFSPLVISPSSLGGSQTLSLLSLNNSVARFCFAHL